MNVKTHLIAARGLLLALPKIIAEAARENFGAWPVTSCKLMMAPPMARRLSHISPYIAVMILPGSFLMLPLLAWWLDRRRKGAPEQRKKFEAQSPPAAATPAIAVPSQAPVRTD